MTFHEVMEGSLRRLNETRTQRFTFSIDAAIPHTLQMVRETTATVRGSLWIQGAATAVPVEGTLEMSPLKKRRLRYRLSWQSDDGKQYRFDGWKTLRYLRLLSSWTTLPGAVYDADGRVWASAELKFSLRRQLPRLLASIRFGARHDALSEPRWRNQPGRTEVWYTTLTDPDSGTGVWLHHELIAPDTGKPYVHGWISVFPPDSVPVTRRFGPYACSANPLQSLAEHGMTVSPQRMSGDLGDVSWDLRCAGNRSQPLFPMSRTVWRRSLLPASQIVPQPSARFSGPIGYPAKKLSLQDASGASARVYGHGNAQRWIWLHADLGNDDVLEIIGAVARQHSLRWLPMLVFIQLRRHGKVWPRFPLLAAWRFHARIRGDTWTVRGRMGGQQLQVQVTLPTTQTVELEYVDPDGAHALCRNSERATAHIVVQHARRQTTTIEWQLDGTAHAEIGRHPT